jgi:hypothetical protein
LEIQLHADARGALLDPSKAKGYGVRITSFDMGGGTLVGHIAEWPVGQYHKASSGRRDSAYPSRRRLYADIPRKLACGPINQVMQVRSSKFNWGEGSVFSPSSGWFHQHFNTGKEKARQLAFRYSGHPGKYLLGCWRASGKEGVRTCIREGGTSSSRRTRIRRFAKIFD